MSAGADWWWHGKALEKHRYCHWYDESLGRAYLAATTGMEALFRDFPCAICDLYQRAKVHR